MALGFMRRHRRWLFVFLWIVIAAFIILYIPAFRGNGEGGPGDAVGTVGGETISASEFRQAYTRQVQMYERLYRGAWTGECSAPWASRTRSSRRWCSTASLPSRPSG